MNSRAVNEPRECLDIKLPAVTCDPNVDIRSAICCQFSPFSAFQAAKRRLSHSDVMGTGVMLGSSRAIGSCSDQIASQFLGQGRHRAGVRQVGKGPHQ